MDSVLPGAEEVLRAMRQAGADLWLLTARNREEWVPQQLARLHLLSWFREVKVVAAQEAVTAKAMLLRKISAAAFFGDTESDYNASLAADIKFYAVTSGQRSASFHRRNGVQNPYINLADAWFAFTKTN
jgi:phosphoglycolate phosphatase-like HAD superfamily hydrolase